MKRFAPLIFILLFFFTDLSAQDLIVKKDGSKIYCRITAEDSVSIAYFRASRHKISVIKKTEVEKYILAKPLPSRRTFKVDTFRSKEELLILKLMGGFATPLSDFGSKDPDKETSGLANPGYLMHASVIVKLTRYFGLSIDYRHQKNSVDNGLIEQTFFAGAPSSLSHSLKSGSWISKGFLGGFYFNLPIETVKNFSLDFTLLAGFPKFESPQLEFVFSQRQSSGWVIQYSGNTSGAAISGKMGFHYRIKRAALNFNLSYFTAKPSFSNVLIRDSFGGIDYIKFEQRMSTLGVELGISLLLFK